MKKRTYLILFLSKLNLLLTSRYIYTTDPLSYFQFSKLTKIYPGRNKETHKIISYFQTSKRTFLDVGLTDRQITNRHTYKRIHKRENKKDRKSKFLLLKNIFSKSFHKDKYSSVLMLFSAERTNTHALIIK